MRQTDVIEEDAGRIARPPTHVADDLTHGGRHALIEHCGQIYVLRITRAGKLILTK